MAYTKLHGFRMALNSWAENFHIESLTEDPSSGQLTSPGRFWYNSTQDAIKFTVLDGENVVVLTVSDTTSAQAALDAAIAQEVTDRNTAVSSVQSELDATQTGAGLGTDGSYSAPVGSNYLDTATSLKDADDLLDTAIKAVSDASVSGLADKVNKAGDSMSGNLAMQGNMVSGLSSPVNATDAANKAYVDNKITGLTWKNPVQQVIDVEADLANVVTTNFVAGDKVAVIETARIYTWDGSDFDSGQFYAVGSAFLVLVTNANYAVEEDVTPGEYTLVQINGAGQINAGVGLSKDGNTINVNLGAGIAQLPSDEVGLDVRANSGLMLTEDGTTDSTGTAAKLAIKLDGTTLSVGVDGLRVSADTMTTINGKAEQTELDATQTGAGLNTDGTYTAPTGSNYLDTSTSLKNADALLDAAVKAEVDRATAAEGDLDDRITTLETGGSVSDLKTALNNGRYTFTASTANTQHTITHNLGSDYVIIQVMVQGDDLKWRNDLVAIEEIDNDSFLIEMTESRKVKVSVIAADQIA